MKESKAKSRKSKAADTRKSARLSAFSLFLLHTCKIYYHCGGLMVEP